MLSRHLGTNSCLSHSAATSSSGAACRQPLAGCLHAYKAERQDYTPIPFNQQQQLKQQQQQRLPQQPPQQQWVQPGPWQQQQWPAAAATPQQGSVQPSNPPQQQQAPQRRVRRSRSQLLEQREQQEQASPWQQPQQQQAPRPPGQRSPPSAQEDGWFVEQPQDGWLSQQPQGPWSEQQAQWQQQLQQQQQQQEQVNAVEWREVVDQLQDWLDQGDGNQGVPVRLVSKAYRMGNAAAWFHEGKYLQSSVLHEEVMARSGRGQLEVAALTHLIRTASSRRDAALALSAISAVRHVAIGQGRVQPWPDSFLKAFIKMTTLCDSHEVLVSAMQRPNELGFVFKHKSFNIALKHWGNSLELHKLQQIMLVAARAGLPPDARMAYALVRTCVNAKQWGKLDEVLGWFRAQGVTQYKPAMQKLLQQAAAEMAAAAAAEDGAGGDEGVGDAAAVVAVGSVE